MKIYRINYMSDHDGCLVGWATSKEGAGEKARQFAELHPGEIGDGLIRTSISVLDIPTTKRGLIHWLNVHLDTDNG